jgi:hypothetical protein
LKARNKLKRKIGRKKKESHEEIKRNGETNYERR